MKTCRIFIALVLSSFVGNPIAADEAAFQKCVNARGPEYVQARTDLLAAGVQRSYLQQMSRSSDWNEQLTAMAVLGWMEHGQQYQRLVDSEKIRNLAGRERYIWSTDPEVVDETLLPLAYEFLMKDTAGSAGHEAAARIIPFLAGKGAGQYPQLLLAALADQDVTNESREAVARVAARLPQEVLTARDFARVLTAETARTGASEEVVGQLLNGIVGRAAVTADDDKRDIISQLLQTEDIARVAGSKRIVYTVGGIGGPNAVPVVVDFLKKSSNEADQRWAIGALAAIGSPAASNPILEVLHARGTSDGIRLAAVRELAKCTYSQGVVNSLGEILHDERRSNSVRESAYKSLQQMLKQNRNDDDRSGAIKGLLRGIDPNALRPLPGARDNPRSNGR